MAATFTVRICAKEECCHLVLTLVSQAVNHPERNQLPPAFWVPGKKGKMASGLSFKGSNKRLGLEQEEWSLCPVWFYRPLSANKS